MLFDPFIFKNRIFIHQHFSSVLTDDPGHDTEQSTFSRSIKSQDSYTVTFFHLKMYILEHLMAAEAIAKETHL